LRKICARCRQKCSSLVVDDDDNDNDDVLLVDDIFNNTQQHTIPSSEHFSCLFLFFSSGSFVPPKILAKILAKTSEMFKFGLFRRKQTKKHIKSWD